MKKNLIIVILIIILGSSIIVILRYEQNKMKFSEYNVLKLSANDEIILPSKIIQTIKLFPSTTQKELITESNIKRIYLNNETLNLNYNDSFDYFTPSQNYNLNNQQITFLKSGNYNIKIRLSNSNSINEYTLMVNVNLEPEIIISNLNPPQGSLVVVTINNLRSNSIVNIESEIPTSATYKNNDISIIYIPINYKYEPKDYKLNILIDDSLHNYSLNVIKSDYDEISFDISTSVSNSTVNSADANAEYRAKVWPLYQSSIEDILWDGSLIKPVEENRISSSFGQYRYINGSDTPSRHSGIDYAADCGTPVYAAARGVVNLAENLMLSGNTVVIDHGLGLKSYYFHLDDLKVNQDEIVESNQLIGHVGTTGYSTGCHLHFQVSIKNNPINPEFLYLY